MQSGSSPNVLSRSCPRATTCSLAWPRSTLATCVAPNRCPTRATHDRILRASTTGSGAGLELVQADVAGAASIFVVPVAEVLGQMPVAAADTRRVALHLPQQLAARVVELAVLLEHRAPFHEIGRRVNQQALGFEPVAARASRFLLVVLERSRCARVHDESHVGSIDAHPECDRGHDDVGPLAEERILVAAALAVRESGVIGQGSMADPGQPCRERIDFAARRAVDDARFAFVPRKDVDELLLERGARQRPIDQVRPIERSDELRRILETELRRDVAPHPARRGGRVGMKADPRQQLPQTPKLAVLGPEVVSPLADAMRLVDGDKTDLDRREQGQKMLGPFADQALGRHVEQLVPSLTQPGHDVCFLAWRQRAVEQRRRPRRCRRACPPDPSSAR